MTPSHPKRRSVFAEKLGAYADFVSIDEAATARLGSWRAFFRERIGDRFDGRIVLEIGCADANTLIAMASKHASTAFIGLDWKYRQLFHGAERIASLALPNAALLRARAQDIRTMFADGEVDEVLIFQPEPCDRPEEAANQLLKRPFFDDLAHILTAHGTIALKTDHAALFDAARVAASASFEDVFSSTDFWNDTAARERTRQRPFADETTLFERRFIRRRQPIFYCELARRRL